MLRQINFLLEDARKKKCSFITKNGLEKVDTWIYFQSSGLSKNLLNNLKFIFLTIIKETKENTFFLIKNYKYRKMLLNGY